MGAPVASETVQRHLQSALVDLIDLSLQGKQAHWLVQGSNFRSIHLQLDEVIEEVRLASDDVAERLVAIGGSPDGRSQTVARDSALDEIESGVISGDKVVSLFESKLQGAADRIKATLADLEEDLLSQDLLIGIATGLEKQAWFFRAASA